MVEKVKAALLAMQRYSWEQGVCALAFMESGDEEAVIQMCYDAVNRQTPDGRLANLGAQHGVTDPVAIIPALIRAVEITGDIVLQNALDKAWEWALKNAPRNDKGIVYHMDNERRFWVDSLYMFPPVLLCGGYVEEAIKQADGYIEALWDNDKKLFHHIWNDETKVFDTPEFWGVGNGWAIAGLGRMIEGLAGELPIEQTNNYKNARERYISIVNKTIEAALQYRDNDLFHNFLDQSESFLEVNFAQMLCYTIAKGVKQRWLPDNLLAEARQIRHTIHKHVSPYGIVSPVCGAPYFNKPGIAPEGQAFFILMESVF